MADELNLHSLDKRVTKLELWRENWEQNMRIVLGQIIDEKLDKRFGWLSRTWQGVLQAVVIALILYFLGLPSAG